MAPRRRRRRRSSDSSSSSSEEEEDEEEDAEDLPPLPAGWWRELPAPTGITWVEDILETNNELIAAVKENMELGRLDQVVEYQKILQKNLLQLVDFCDE